MMLWSIARLAATAAVVVCVSGHAKRTPEQLADYHREIARGAEALSACLETPELKELNTRIIASRQVSFHHLRKARGIDIEPRDYAADKPSMEKWAKVDHDKTGAFKDKDIKNPEELFHFKWDNVPSRNVSTCILTPENVWGPYWQERAPYRQDITEGQAGVYMRLALQVVDIAACTPLQGARVDIWQTNALGVYAKQMRGANQQPVYWLTGAQATSKWGTVDFDTIFPGHYTGRAVHTHVSVRPGDKFNDPKGFVHAGQIFYDEKPRESIDKLEPYTRNKQEFVTNLEDGFTPYSASAKYDPFAQYGWIDPNDHAKGLVAWITVGVNLTATGIEQPGK